jgi:hypothetical protein
MNGSTLNSSWGVKNHSEKTNGTLHSPFNPAEILTIQLCHGFLGVAGLIENVFIIIVILRLRKIMLDFPSNRFVLSLAIADSVSCLSTIAAVLCITTGRKFEIFCLIIQFTLLTSSGNLLVLTFNRFLSLHSALKYPALMTTQRAVRLQFVPWIVATIFSALSILSNRLIGIPCMIYVKNLYYSINILMITALNIYMFKIARDKRKMDERNPAVVNDTHRNSRLRIRLLIVNLIFFASCIPLMIIFYLYPSKRSRESTAYIRKVVWCYFAVLFNAAVHPLVYAARLPTFKRYFDGLKEKLSLNCRAQDNNKCEVFVVSELILNLHQLPITGETA